MASFLVALILLLDVHGSIKGATPVTLSPSEVALVCGGGQLELTCNTTGPAHEWDFRISENGTMTTPSGRLVTNQADLTLVPVVTDSIIFNVSRVSLPESVPLVSKLVIAPTRSSINGTEVMCTCTDVVANAASSTTVFIINSMLQDHPVVNFTWPFEQPERDSTQNVTLMWNESLNFVLFSYHVNITPAALYTFDETRATVDILLGVIYNVSIVATHLSLCGRAMTIISTGLYYPDCGGQRNGTSLLGVIDYLNPAAEASSITFRHCPPTMSPSEGDTMYYPTNSMMTTDMAKIIGGIIGSLLGVILFSVSAITLGAILILTRRKGLMNSCSRKPQDECSISNTDIELKPSQDESQDDNKTAFEPRGLVYAEVGKSSLKHRHNEQLSNLLDLDDSHVEYAQLNHKALTKRPVDSEVVDESLSVSLDNLLIQLRPQVGPKWYQFGQAAGIEKEVLDKFTQQCSPEGCIIEMLDYWLRRQEIRPTWKDVAKILKEINLPKLALDIEQVYSTGKLPIDVDMNWLPQIEQDNNIKAELPPPVPPKITNQDWDKNPSDHDRLDPIMNSSNHLLDSRMTELDNSVPTLPPKPNNYWYESSSTNVPARPPKPPAAGKTINYT